MDHRADLLWPILHFQLTPSASASVREGTYLSYTLRLPLLHFRLAERPWFVCLNLCPISCPFPLPKQYKESFRENENQAQGMQDIACSIRGMCATVYSFSSISFYQVFWRKPFKHTEMDALRHCQQQFVDHCDCQCTTHILSAKEYYSNAWSLKIPVTFRYCSCFQVVNKYFNRWEEALLKRI